MKMITLIRRSVAITLALNLWSIDAFGATGNLIAAIEALPATETSLSYEVRLANQSEPLTTIIGTRYRRSGTTTWIVAAPAVRIRPDWTQTPIQRSEGFAGMIFFLQPDTSYDVEVTLDQGGVLDSQTQAMSTRGTPRDKPISPNTVDVSSDSDLASAITSASAGDVILLANGTYDGDLDLTASGTYDNPIILRGESRQGVLLTTNSSKFGKTTFEVTGDHWTVENLTIENTNSGGFAIRGRGAANFTVRNCRLKGRYGIDAVSLGSSFNSNWTIYNNIVVGQKSWADILIALDQNDTSTLFGGDGIADINGGGHEIYQNTISGFGDSLGVSDPFKNTIDGTLAQMNRGIVFHNNEVLWGGDDAFELDDAYSHVAAYQNRVVNTANLYSVQPNIAHGGPRYFFQNVSINPHGVGTGAVLKFKTSGPSLIQVGFVVNNTIYASTMKNNAWGLAMPRDGISVNHTWLLNNVLFLTQARTSGIYNNDTVGDWRWHDYMAVGTTSGPEDFGYGNWDDSVGQNIQGHSGLAAFKAQGYQAVAPFGLVRPVHQNSIEITSSDIDATAVTMPADYRTLAMGGDIFPAAGSGLVGTGITMPQLSQDNGSDIGARTRGSSTPLYGALLGPVPKPPVLLVD